LLADDDVFSCGSFDAFVTKLVWAGGEGYASANARMCSAFTDRPLMPSECVALVKAATEVALADEQVAVGSRG
jgi:hypothetical protein